MPKTICPNPKENRRVNQVYLDPYVQVPGSPPLYFNSPHACKRGKPSISPNSHVFFFITSPLDDLSRLGAGRSARAPWPRATRTAYRKFVQFPYSFFPVPTRDKKQALFHLAGVSLFRLKIQKRTLDSPASSGRPPKTLLQVILFPLNRLPQTIRNVVVIIILVRSRTGLPREECSSPLQSRPVPSSSEKRGRWV